MNSFIDLFIDHLEWVIIIFIILLLIKTIHFFIVKKDSWTLSDWIFFSHYRMVETYSEKHRNFKKTQNAMSVIVLVYMFIIIAVFLFDAFVSD